MESKKFKQSKKKMNSPSFAIFLTLIVSIIIGIVSILRNDPTVSFSAKLTISIIFFYFLGAIIQKIYMSIISEDHREEGQKEEKMEV